MKNILTIGKKSKIAFENLKKISHKRINKTLGKKIIKYIMRKKIKIILDAISAYELIRIANLCVSSVYIEIVFSFSNLIKFSKLKLIKFFDILSFISLSKKYANFDVK